MADPTPNPADAAPDPAQPEPVETAAAADPAADWPDDWPDDWRARLADGDQRLERRLGRFASPRSVVDSLLAAEQRLRGGEPGAPGAGAPEAWEDYEVELPDGMVVGEADRPLVDGFLEAAHKADMTPVQVNRALDWYYRQHDEMQAERAAADEEAHIGALEELRAAWGKDFRANVNMVDAFLEDAPEGLKENLLGARMADGTLFGDSAPALIWLDRLARSLTPAATLAPAAPSGPARAITDEIAAIERRMATDRAGYFRDETAQARYRELLEARARTGRRR